MRLICFVNNFVGWKVLEYLVSADSEVVAVVVHPEDNNRKFGNEILSIVPEGIPIVEADSLRTDSTLDLIRNLNPDLGVSAYFGFILKKSLLDLFPAGCINIHPSLLPYNKGPYPNVWSIIDGTPAGVSVHYIDETIDTGPLLAQREVKTELWDTGISLYKKCQKEATILFKDFWPDFLSGQVKAVPQKEPGTYYKKNAVGAIDEIDLNEEVRAGVLLNVLRARTFPPYEGAYFKVNGKKIFVRVEFFDENGNPFEDQ